MLAPGATDEGDGSSEIEVDVTGMDGSFDTLRIVGTSGPDAFATSFLAVNLNADETVPDPDVTLEDYLSLELIAGDGDDELSVDPFDAFARATLLGGDGDDRLSGRLGGDDVLDAGPGRDVADYSGGKGGTSSGRSPGRRCSGPALGRGRERRGCGPLRQDDTVSYVGKRSARPGSAAPSTPST